MGDGKGKPGYCSLCVHPGVKAINRIINEGGNAGRVNAYLEQTYDKGVDRRTIYAHREHALSPENKVIQAAEIGRKQLTIRKTSTTEFLESLRDIGFSKAIEDPEKVSIEHALKAAQILESRKDRGGDQLNILIAISTGQAPPILIEDGQVVEGEVRDVTPPTGGEAVSSQENE